MEQHVNSMAGSVEWQWIHVRSGEHNIHYSNVLIDFLLLINTLFQKSYLSAIAKLHAIVIDCSQLDIE